MLSSGGHAYQLLLNDRRGGPSKPPGGDGKLYVLSVAGNAVLRYHGTDGSFDQRFAAIIASGLAGGPLHLAFKSLACH